MYDIDMEDDIRALEIFLGNPPNRGVSRRRPILEGDILFEVHIDYKEGDYCIIPQKKTE